MGAINKSVKNSLAVIANSLTGGGVSLSLVKSGVAYCFEEAGGSMGLTKKVCIPNADFSNRANVELAEGQTLHESLHCIYTDFDALTWLKKDMYFDFRKSIANCIEDAYIEAFGEQRWRGVRKILNRRLVQYIRKGYFPSVDELEGLQLISQHIYYFFTFKRNKAPLHTHYEQCSVKIMNDFGTTFFYELENVLEKGLTTKSTMENVALANEIVDWLVKLAPEQPQQNQEPQQSKSSESQQGEQSGSDKQEGSNGESQQDDSGKSQQGEQSGSDKQEGSNGESQQDDSGKSQQGEQSGSDKQEGSNGESQLGDSGKSQQGEQSGSDKQGGSNGESQQGDSGKSQQGEQSGSDKQEGSNGESQQGDSGKSQQGEQSGSDKQEGSNGESQQGDSGKSQQGAQSTSNTSNEQTKNNESSGITPKHHRSDDSSGLTAKKLESLKEQARNKPVDVATDLAKQAIKSLDESANDSSIELELCRSAAIRDTDERFVHHREIRTLEAIIRRPLQAMLQAQTWKRESFGRRGDLDSSRLNRVLTDGKAMRQETVTEGDNAAVSLLVDASSSMKRSSSDGNGNSLTRMEVAEITVGAMTNVLEGLGIPCEAAKFAGPSGLGPTMQTYKSFNEKPRTLLGRLGRAPKGNTPTGEALVTALANLSVRTEPKKILYVITDGEARSQMALERAYEMAISVHVKVKFICVGVKWKYPFAQDDVVEIEQAKDLPRVMRKMSLKDL
ncbi:hypothetical protein OH460_08765 [Vibrio sp. Makdt]|uniref:hypothetical protein n=1 Tax=Vibrio sp. Makdt TaxID=2998828 RepID=UPI0022CD28EF|nr:hypothetical protein [Vibrio sp. Makdt]MDA0152393.1 hypothetical protein [Vibrio sp. Makdt]